MATSEEPGYTVHERVGISGSSLEWSEIVLAGEWGGFRAPLNPRRAIWLHKKNQAGLFTMFSEEKKQELIQALDKRLKKFGNSLKCPMCGNQHFSIADAYLRNDLQTDLKSLDLGGPSIPAIAIICANCGFISQHAIGVLGLMSEGEASND